MATTAKIGRNKRSPSCKNQKFRTAANKERRINRAKRKRETDKVKVLKVPRGTARKLRRNPPVLKKGH